MNAVTLVNMALHALLISVIGWGFVRWGVPDARHRAWASLLVLHAAVIAPWLMEIRPDRSINPSEEVSPASAVASWKPDWKISTASVAPPRLHAATLVAEPAWSVADLARVVCGVLILGMIVMALRHCAMSLAAWRWRRTLRQPTREEQGALPAAARDVRLGVSRDDVCPCVVGLWRPVIAVPQRIIREWNLRQWTWLLRHEGEHVRSRDTLTAWLLGWTKALLWWNPFVHALVEQWSQAREEICDAAAVAGERDSTAYSEFLLDIAASVRAPSPMLLHMAASRPARRLRARMTAMLAKRSVRERVSHLFLLAGFATMAFIAALVSCVGLKAEESPARKTAGPEAASPKVESALSPELSTRTFRAWHDFVKPSVGAMATLSDQGISFPEGASASFVPSTGQLIVRNTVANLERIEMLLRAYQAQKDAVWARLAAKWITVDTTIPDASSLRIASMLDGKTDMAILTDAEYQIIVRTLTQRGGDLVSAPSLITRFGQGAGVEVMRGIPGKDPAGAAKDLAKAGPALIGPRIHYLVQFEGEKLDLEAQAEVEERDENDRANPQVRHLRKSATVTMGNGETLFLRMGPSAANPERVVLLFITAELSDSKGNRLSVEGARRLLDEAQKNIPGREQTGKLDVPDRDKNPLTAEQLEKVEGLLLKAWSYYNLADFDNSMRTFQDALRIDPSNAAARRGMERVEQRRTEGFDSASDRARAKILGPLVDTKLNNGAYYAEKMEKIIFPQVQCKGATVEEMVEFLRIKSRDYDKVENDPARRGVNLLMKPGMAPTTALITLDLKNVSMSEALKQITELGGMTYKIENFAVVVIPLPEPGADAKAPVDAKSVDISVWVADIAHGKKDEAWFEVIPNLLPKQLDPPKVDSDSKAERAMSMAEATKRGLFKLGTYSLTGVFTPQQHDLLRRAFESRKDIKTITLPTITTGNGKVATFKEDDKGLVLQIETASGPDGSTWDLMISADQRLTNEKRQGISTAVTIWDGQTAAMGALLKKDGEGSASRIIFITVKAKK